MIPNHQENQNIKENEIIQDYTIGCKTEVFSLTGKDYITTCLYCVGVMLVNFLNAVLKVDLELNPTS